MFSVSEAEAAAICAAYERGGELAAAVELRRHFPGIDSTAKAREAARIIAGWKPLPKRPTVLPRRRKTLDRVKRTLPVKQWFCDRVFGAGPRRRSTSEVVQITDRAAQCMPFSDPTPTKGLAHEPGGNRMSLTADRSVPAVPALLTRTEVTACATTAVVGDRAEWNC
jgi:hypothetical protein